MLARLPFLLRSMTPSPSPPAITRDSESLSTESIPREQEQDKTLLALWVLYQLLPGGGANSPFRRLGRVDFIYKGLVNQGHL